MTFEDSDVLDEYIKREANTPMPKKFAAGAITYLSRDFGMLQSLFSQPRIAGFGFSQHGDFFSHPIQIGFDRAPEVILGTGWDHRADIWNLGTLVSFFQCYCHDYYEDF